MLNQAIGVPSEVDHWLQKRLIEAEFSKSYF